MRKRIGVVINPTARSGHAKVLGTKLIKYLKYRGQEVIDLSGSDWNDAIKRARNGLFAKNLNALVVAGGDGTVHLGTNIVAETRLPFGIVPIGTGNDAARGLGIPENDVKSSVDLIVDGLKNDKLTPIDLGHAADVKRSGMYEWFMANAGGGFITKVSRRRETIKYPRGPVGYMLALFVEMMRLKPEKYRITIDGKSQKFESILFGVANGPDIGGGMQLFPNASFDNNRLDFSSVVPMSKKRFINLANRVKTEDLTGTPELFLAHGKEIIVEALGKTENIYADGEDIGPLPMRYTVVPNGLYVISARPIHRTKLAQEVADEAKVNYSDSITESIFRKVLNKVKDEKK